jgi:Tfp pilus assembly protein PilN
MSLRSKFQGQHPYIGYLNSSEKNLTFAEVVHSRLQFLVQLGAVPSVCACALFVLLFPYETRAGKGRSSGHPRQGSGLILSGSP